MDFFFFFTDYDNQTITYITWYYYWYLQSNYNSYLHKNIAKISFIYYNWEINQSPHNIFVGLKQLTITRPLIKIHFSLFRSLFFIFYLVQQQPNFFFTYVSRGWTSKSHIFNTRDLLFRLDSTCHFSSIWVSIYRKKKKKTQSLAMGMITIAPPGIQVSFHD